MDITDHLKEQKYVAFLDVLGFKELVRSKGEKLNRYFKTIENALIDIQSDKEGEITSQLVSDSTILACDLNNQNLRLLLKAVQAIQAKCALENIWIRGAITIGDIYFNRDLNIVVGNGLSDAYLLESQEKFPRVIIDPKVLKKEYGFGTRKIFIERFNISQERNRIPLIYDPSEQNDSVENEAIFVAFAERIFYDDKDNMETIYNNIQNELYNSQITYQKYLWLKQYFFNSLNRMSYYYANMRHFRLPYDAKAYGKIENYKSKFAHL